LYISTHAATAQTAARPMELLFSKEVLLNQDEEAARVTTTLGDAG
jgi:hypothetical protein